MLRKVREGSETLAMAWFDLFEGYIEERYRTLNKLCWSRLGIGSEVDKGWQLWHLETTTSCISPDSSRWLRGLPCGTISVSSVPFTFRSSLISLDLCMMISVVYTAIIAVLVQIEIWGKYSITKSSELKRFSNFTVERSTIFNLVIKCARVTVLKLSIVTPVKTSFRLLILLFKGDLS